MEIICTKEDIMKVINEIDCILKRNEVFIKFYGGKTRAEIGDDEIFDNVVKLCENTKLLMIYRKVLVLKLEELT